MQGWQLPPSAKPSSTSVHTWETFHAFESFSLKKVQLSTLHHFPERERETANEERLLGAPRKKLFQVGRETEAAKRETVRKAEPSGHPFNEAQGGSSSPIRQREQPLGHAGTRFPGWAHHFRIGIHPGSRRPTRSQPSTGMQSRSRPPPPRLDWARY